MKAYLSLLRIVSFILIFVIGMLAGMAALVGIGAYGAMNLSLNDLASFGFAVDTGLFRDDANQDIRDFSIVDMVTEIIAIGALGDEGTLNYISEEYGLVLPDEGEQPLLDAMRDVPLSIIFTPEGLDIALNSVFIGDVFGYTRVDPDDSAENPDGGASDGDTGTENSGEENSDQSTVNPVNSTEISGDNATNADTTTPDNDTTTPNPDTTEPDTESTVPNYTWKTEDGEIVVGVQAKLANYTVYQLLNNEVNLTGLVGDTPIGEIAGYTYDEFSGKWIREVEGEEDKYEELTGFIGVIADRKLDNLDGVLDGALMGDILDYTKKTTENDEYVVLRQEDDGTLIYQWQMKGESGELQDVDSLMNVVANTTFDEIGNLTSKLTLGDVVGETSCKYVNLIGPETKITNLSEKADAVFTDSTMAMFVDAGLINFEDPADEEKFKDAFGMYTMNGFIEKVMNPTIDDTTNDTTQDTSSDNIAEDTANTTE